MTLDLLHAGLVLRAATPSDHARITKDWLMSYAPRVKCEPSYYREGQRRIIDSLLPLAHVLYRTGSEIHGWVCGEPGVAHYVYVPAELRRNGLARAMVLAVCGESGVHTHRRMPGLSGFVNWHYNPYRIGVAA